VECCAFWSTIIFTNVKTAALEAGCNLATDGKRAGLPVGPSHLGCLIHFGSVSKLGINLSSELAMTKRSFPATLGEGRFEREVHSKPDRIPSNA
jgi:hypothetical protein